MPSSKPAKNAVSSTREFKSLCIAASKKYKLRITDEGIRHLRLTMNNVIASATLLPEAIDVIYASLTEKKTRRASLDDVREWLLEAPPVDDDRADSASAEREKQHHVRKLLTWKRVNRQTYYLVDWEPTWEPRNHVQESVIAAFEKERRLLVRKKFFEDEAVEDNTLNETEA